MYNNYTINVHVAAGAAQTKRELTRLPFCSYLEAHLGCCVYRECHSCPSNQSVTSGNQPATKNVLEGELVMKKCIQALLCAGLLTTMSWAQEFPKTPKQETLAEAIRFEKYKIAAAEAQAKKDAAEARQTRPSAAKKARKQGQADAAKR